MKNSELYAKKVKALLPKSADEVVECEPPELVRLMVEAALAEDATATQAARAIASLDAEYVDLNELRVSPVNDIVGCVGRSFPDIKHKAKRITIGLGRVFHRVNALDLSYLEKKTKREVRRILREDIGLSLYAESVVTLLGLSGHAIPVDILLLEALKLDGRIHPDSDLPDLQGFLERIIHSTRARGAHEALREYAAKHAPRVRRELARRQKIADAKARAEAREAEAARKVAEEKAKKEAARKAAAEEKAKQAKKAAKKKAKSRAKKKPAPKATGKAKPARTTRKTVKKAAKETARSASGKKRTRARTTRKQSGE